MNDQQLHQAAAMYGLSPDKIGPIAKGYRNTSYPIRVDGKYVNLILYKNEDGILDRIKRTNRLTRELEKSRLPLRSPFSDKILIIKSSKGNRNRFASLYTYLPGQTIPWEAYSMKHIKLLGWAMSSLHQSLRKIEAQDFPDVYDEYLHIVERMQNHMLDTDIFEAIRSKLQILVEPKTLKRMADFLVACRQIKNRQILHMDFVRGNVLFGDASSSDSFSIDGVALTGVLDFEKACVGHPLTDMARTLAFLYVDCSTKSSSQIYRYFIESGYVKRGQNKIKPLTVTGLNDENYDVLQSSIDLFLLYDFYKLLRANPYESLEQNYHYIRTRDTLLSRKLLYYI